MPFGPGSAVSCYGRIKNFPNYPYRKHRRSFLSPSRQKSLPKRTSLANPPRHPVLSLTSQTHSLHSSISSETTRKVVQRRTLITKGPRAPVNYYSKLYNRTNLALLVRKGFTIRLLVRTHCTIIYILQAAL